MLVYYQATPCEWLSITSTKLLCKKISYEKINLEKSSAKWRPFYLGISPFPSHSLSMSLSLYMCISMQKTSSLDVWVSDCKTSSWQDIALCTIISDIYSVYVEEDDILRSWRHENLCIYTKKLLQLNSLYTFYQHLRHCPVSWYAFPMLIDEADFQTDLREWVRTPAWYHMKHGRHGHCFIVPTIQHNLFIVGHVGVFITF